MTTIKTVWWGDEDNIASSVKENQERVDLVEKIIDKHLDWQDAETSIADLLDDLLHYCKLHEISFDNCLERGRKYFEEEGGL